MRQQPSAKELLEAARQALREDLAKNLSGRQRYVALMAANAIAIASRQMAEDETLPRRFGDRLGDLLGDPNDPWALEWMLVDRLRSGGFGPGDPQHADLHRYLVDRTAAALDESNPRYPRD